MQLPRHGYIREGIVYIRGVGYILVYGGHLTMRLPRHGYIREGIVYIRRGRLYTSVCGAPDDAATAA